MRLEIPGFMGLSFETIAAVDEHAALPHYKLTEESGKSKITPNCIFLIDSGGHYRFQLFYSGLTFKIFT